MYHFIVTETQTPPRNIFVEQGGWKRQRCMECNGVVALTWNHDTLWISKMSCEMMRIFVVVTKLSRRLAVHTLAKYGKQIPEIYPYKNNILFVRNNFLICIQPTIKKQDMFHYQYLISFVVEPTFHYETPITGGFTSQRASNAKCSKGYRWWLSVII